MSVAFGANGNFVSRSGTYLDITGPFTISAWVSQGATTPTGGSYRNYYTYGDINRVHPYICVSSDPNTNNVRLAYFNGSTYIQTVASFTPVVNIFFYCTIRYDPATHNLDFIVSTATYTDTIIETLVVDLSAISFIEKNEQIGGSWADFNFSCTTVYQTNWSIATIGGNKTRTTVNPVGNYYRAFNKFLSPTDIKDTTHWANDWILTGTIPWPTQVGNIIFSDNFNNGDNSLFANWDLQNNSITQPGGCTLPGYCIACDGGYSRHLINPFPSVNYRLQMATKLTNIVIGTSQIETIWLDTFGPSSGINLIFSFYSNGAIGVRMNNVISTEYSPGGLIPVDGTWFAIQFRLAIITNQSIQIDVVVNNVAVWSHLYNWHPYDPSTIGGPNFTAIWVNAISTRGSSDGEFAIFAFDNIEVDNTNAIANWVPCTPVPSSMGSPTPGLLITSVIRVDTIITITCIGIRVFPGVTAYAANPEGNYFNQTVTSVTATQIVITIDDPLIPGTYTVQAYNKPFCWEVGTATVPPPDISGIYFISPGNTHDVYNTRENKIPDPTVRTGLIGD
jgi:hypothetical protein